MSLLKLKNGIEFQLRNDINQTTRDGKVWFIRFDILGYYSPEFLQENFVKENTSILKILNEDKEEVLSLENYNIIISMQIFTDVTDIEESYITVQMKKEKIDDERID